MHTQQKTAANRWLGPAAPDGAREVTLTPSASGPPPPPRRYALRVRTGGTRGAGTDAGVSVRLIGARGESGWLPLPAGPQHLARGAEDAFELRAPDIGALRRLGVRSDGAGESPAWWLDWVRVDAAAAAAPPPPSGINSSSSSRGGLGPQEVASAPQPAWFVARRWLDAAHGLEVELDAQSRPPPGDGDSGSQALYCVEVHTGDVRGAGTDAGVFVELLGERGATSGPRALLPSPPSAAAFARGAVDAFELRLPALGELSALRVWTDGRGAPWHLDFVAVRERAPHAGGGGGGPGRVWFFPFGGWIGSSGNSGASGAVTIAATLHDPRPRLATYRVVARTSDAPGAGPTSADVWLELVSAAPGGASSGRQPLRVRQGAPPPFARGAADVFELTCRHLGELGAAVVAHDGRGAHPAWHLEQVRGRFCQWICRRALRSKGRFDLSSLLLFLPFLP